MEPANKPSGTQENKNVPFIKKMTDSATSFFRKSHPPIQDSQEKPQPSSEKTRLLNNNSGGGYGCKP